MAIFPTFFLGNTGQENVFYDILERKTAFQGQKKKRSNRRKIDIFPKGLNYGFGPKMIIFPTFFFSGKKRREKGLLRYSRKKKTPF